VRIAYLCCDIGVSSGGKGGNAVHVREMVRAFRSLGHEVRVFVASGDGVAERDDIGAEVIALEGFAGEVARLPGAEEAGLPAHLSREWRRLLYSEYAQRALRPALAWYQPDVIYERYSLFAYAGVELAQALDAPLLLEVNAPLSREASAHRGLVLTQLAAELERRIFCAADALVVVSNALRDYATQLGATPERITVLPNGVDAARFHPGASGDAVRARFGLNGERVVGFVGSLKPWHDLDTLQAAVRLVSNGGGRVRLLVVGDGPRLAQLREANGDVTCAGAVDHQDVPAYLAAMDVVVVPYADGGDHYFSPLKLAEAMAMAKPVIGARTGQVAELVVHGETGLLYEPGRPDDLADKIRQVIEAPDLAARMGAAARERIVATRTWEGNARRVEELAQGLLDRRRAP